MARNLPESERREAILHAAKRCIVDCGFAATRMDDVARAAGLSKGGLYFHFASKDALLVGVVGRENKRLEALLDASEAFEGPLAERIDGLVSLFIAYLRDNTDAARVSQCLLDEGLRNAEVAGALRAGEALFLARLESLFAAAVESGEAPQAMAPELAARLCMALIEGVKTKFLHFPEWPWDQVIAELRRVMFAGLLGLEGAP
jgi:AcrR family transcriptional regulator